MSALRGAVYARSIDTARGRQALEDALALPIETLPLDDDVCRAALEWAARLQQRRAYDAFYVAAAEQLGVELWTADQRLANGARASGAAWAHWVGEA